MKMLKKILLALVVIVVVLAVIGFFLPSHYRVERSVMMNAKPDAIFTHINTLKKWPEWTAWTVQRFPDMKLTYEGAASGPSAAYSWSSEKMGAGRMEVIESVPSRKVAMKLAFDKPMQTTNRVEFTLAPQADQTLVSWTMSGPMPYLSKLMTTAIFCCP